MLIDRPYLTITAATNSKERRPPMPIQDNIQKAGREAAKVYYIYFNIVSIFLTLLTILDTFGYEDFKSMHEN